MKHGRKARSRQLIVTLTCCGALGYFAVHAIHGRHGLDARVRLIERSQVLEQEIVRLEIVRFRLARDVGLLDARSPHPDLVEEIAFDILNFIRAGDAVLVDALGPR
jgi:cell division protein FtsB